MTHAAEPARDDTYGQVPEQAGPGQWTEGDDPDQIIVPPEPRPELTTEQIARAGQQAPEPPAADQQQVVPAQPDAHGGTAGAAGQNGSAEPPMRLLDADEMQGIVDRWRDIQAGFVDEPRKAVKEADALVADLMQRLAQMFAGEREQLESRLNAEGSISTEDLRQGLQRYRSFFERLLAA